MKTLTSFFFIATIFVTTSAFADGPKKNVDAGTVLVMAPVYKTVTDCDITYYRTKINGENVLLDDKGRFIKYLCDDEESKLKVMPAIYKAIMIPVGLMTGLK
ncbi:MAG TPA: hypothetical protein PLD84_08605 [Chitinophagales bacterium]|nr:hypothetical protein [Chitinophagales bacterium]